MRSAKLRAGVIASRVGRHLSGIGAAALIALLLSAGSAAAAGLPVITEESALAGPNSAILRAKIDPFGKATTCMVEYVDEARYNASEYAEASTMPCSEGLKPSSEEHSVIAEIAGLAIETGYHFRFIAVNASGEEDMGADTTFATFGIEAFGVGLLDANGNALTQAGGHPYEYTTSIAIDHSTETASPSGDLQDVEVELPAGLVGDPAATPKCPGRDAESKECSGASQVGTLLVSYGEEHLEEVPLFNIVPPKGVAAAFSARFNAVASAFIDARVRTGGDYGIDADSMNISSIADLREVVVTMWGVPAEASHNAQRGCPQTEGEIRRYVMPCTEVGAPTPFLSDPTSCTGRELSERVAADAYQAPGEFVEKSTTLPAVTGCGRVVFDPSVSVVPESSSTDSPTGLQVELRVPQNEEPEGLATANLKDATVVLPAGVTVNPSEASGLVGCPLLTGKEAYPGQAGIDLENSEPADCPEASKIGTVKLETPLIEHPLLGAIYLAQQGNAGMAGGSNPFGSLLALYIAIEDPETGVIVKLAGEVKANPVTGQLTTSFKENPQLPFENFKLDFFSGQRAPLATPQSCGTYTATSLLEPWSHEAPGETGTPDASPESHFSITSMVGGGACVAPGLAPRLTAGTSDNQAGAFSPLSTLIQRKDGEQALKAVSIALPQGLAGMISKVALCGEAEADAGTCPAASKIGNVTVQVGVGSKPVTLPQAGKREDPVYLTGGFEGAPFGLAIVVHPEAGPFNLAEGAGSASERPVVVRAKIEVNPHTAQVTITTPASGPYAMPTMLQGIPVDLQSVDVDVDHEGFIFNPTSCEPMAAAGTITGAEGATATVTSHYQAANCADLAFKPSFTAATSGRTSRRDGASLTTKISYPGATGTEANLKEVKVVLPYALPSRLSTLRKACTARQFDADPSGCPAESVVGHATAQTPILPVALEGPAYFVSNGIVKFPELVVVLQGDGVTIDVAGETFISKKGVTSTTFKTVPDAPISSFQLTLPEGEDSALSANGDLCTKSLMMPTTLIAQNGKQIQQNTKVAVEGCPDKLILDSSKITKHRITLRVTVPAVGKLTAGGHRLTKASRQAKGRQTLRIVLRRHGKGKLKTSVKLAFKPSSGKEAAKAVRVRFR